EPTSLLSWFGRALPLAQLRDAQGQGDHESGEGQQHVPAEDQPDERQQREDRNDEPSGEPRSAVHAVVTSTRRDGSISLRSMRAGQKATISCTLGRPPAKPVTVGGPDRMSGAISRVNRSIAARSRPRTATR